MIEIRFKVPIKKHEELVKEADEVNLALATYVKLKLNGWKIKK